MAKAKKKSTGSIRGTKAENARYEEYVVCMKESKITPRPKAAWILHRRKVQKERRE